MRQAYRTINPYSRIVIHAQLVSTNMLGPYNIHNLLHMTTNLPTIGFVDANRKQQPSIAYIHKKQHPGTALTGHFRPGPINTKYLNAHTHRLYMKGFGLLPGPSQVPLNSAF
jgi:hypothetical protein